MDERYFFAWYGFLFVWEDNIEYLNQIVELMENIKELKIVKIINFRFDRKSKREFMNHIYRCIFDSFGIKEKEKKRNAKQVFLIIFRGDISYNSLFEDTGCDEFERKTFDRIKKIIEYKFVENKDFINNVEIYISIDLLQIENIMKLLKLSIRNFEKNRIGGIPYFIDYWKKIQIKRIPIDQIYAVINGKKGKSIVKIDESPHYKALVEDMNIYKKYFTSLQMGELCDYYSMNKLERLKDNFLYLHGQYRANYIFVNKIDDKYVLLDGVHRVAVLRSRGEKSLVVAEVK